MECLAPQKKRQKKKQTKVCPRPIPSALTSMAEHENEQEYSEQTVTTRIMKIKRFDYLAYLFLDKAENFPPNPRMHTHTHIHALKDKDSVFQFICDNIYFT